MTIVAWIRNKFVGKRQDSFYFDGRMKIDSANVHQDVFPVFRLSRSSRSLGSRDASLNVSKR